MTKAVAIAAAGAAACALVAPSAFVTPGAPTGASAQASLRGVGAAAQETSFGAASVGVCAVAAAGVAAVSRRRTVARRAIRVDPAQWETQERPKFADGLVGSEYAGFGTYEWDPLELSQKWPEHLPWYREAELKHGRVAMLAFVGFIAQDAFRLPFEQCQDPSLTILNSHPKLTSLGFGEGPMWWLLIFCGVVESLRFKQLGLAFEKLTLENAGDLDFGKGFFPKTQEGQLQMRIKELKNGRLAMMAVSGIVTQAQIWLSPNFPWVPVN